MYNDTVEKRGYPVSRSRHPGKPHGALTGEERFFLIRAHFEDIGTGLLSAAVTIMRNLKQKTPQHVKTLAVTTIRSDIETGVRDEEIMAKYGLSREELQALFKALMRALANGASHVEIRN